MEREIIDILRERFEKNAHRHKKLEWIKVYNYIRKNNLLDILETMEETGGEPDIVIFPNGNIAFVDLSKETPNRRSLCYDKDARIKRKKFPAKNSAWEYAEALGCRITNEEEYIFIQTLKDMDMKTSSWIDTPSNIRSLGGGLFGDKRYGRTFIYHNGADSYYSSRGFRLVLDINIDENNG